MVCHKSVEKRIKKLSNIAKAHWGAIDGKNDWADYDCIVVYGLPFLPADFEKDAIRATRNVNEQDPLVRIHEEDVRAFKAGDIATRIIQAFNRIRCRKQTDIDGNCAPCSIYLALASNELGEQIKSHIFDEVPGIKVAKWVIASANPAPTKETCETKILQHLRELSTDCILRKDVITQTGVSENSFDRFVKK